MLFNGEVLLSKLVVISSLILAFQIHAAGKIGLAPVTDGHKQLVIPPAEWK